MIDDPEIRDLFAAEASSAIERMEKDLLALERAPEERPLLDSVFRQAHSLKGSAASLGLSAVESVAHHFEDTLDGARRGRHPFTSGHADKLYRALDVLRKLVQEAVTGQSSGVDLRAALVSLKQPVEEMTGSPKADQVACTPVEESPAFGQRNQAAPIEVEPREDDSAPLVIEETSVRVDTVRLDRALADMGDLVVTAARLGLRKTEVQLLHDSLEVVLKRRRWNGGATEKGDEDDSLQSFIARLELFLRALGDDQARLLSITEHLHEEIQEMRLLPLGVLLNRFPRIVRDLARGEGKQIRLEIDGEDVTADRRLIEKLHGPLTHLVRNAVDHGVEPPAQRHREGKPAESKMRLSVSRRGPMLEVVLEDDGAGLNYAAIRRRAQELRLRTAEQLSQISEHELSTLIFAPGFSTRSEVSKLSGRGAGMDAARSEVESMNGTLTVESAAGKGTKFTILLPLTLATSQVMVCRCGASVYAIPLAYVERSSVFDWSQTFSVEGRPCLEVDEAVVPVTRLERVLGLTPAHFDEYAVDDRRDGRGVCLILRDQTQRWGFLVEDLLGVMEIVVKPISESRLVAGASILPDGKVCLVLQSTELLRIAAHHKEPVPLEELSSPELSPRVRVLLAEDSPTSRGQALQALRKAGYDVTVAENGLQAWALAEVETFDAVISDIEMPEITGIGLTSRLRSLERYQDVPILLVTSLESEESRMAGLEAGASVYLRKSAFSDGSFLKVLERLL